MFQLKPSELQGDPDAREEDEIHGGEEDEEGEDDGNVQSESDSGERNRRCRSEEGYPDGNESTVLELQCVQNVGNHETEDEGCYHNYAAGSQEDENAGNQGDGDSAVVLEGIRGESAITGRCSAGGRGHEGS